MTRATTCLIAATLWAGIAQAATTAYVTDQMRVTLRAGPGEGHVAIRALSSGAEVELLETDAATGYSQVRLANGATGWIKSNNLMNEPAARVRLNAAEERAAKSEQALAQMKAEREQQSELIGRAQSVASENAALKERALALEQDLDMLRRETTALRDDTQRNWFIVGAGVLLVGMLIGLIVPKIRWRRKSRWEYL
jgi:SH3 domain protein